MSAAPQVTAVWRGTLDGRAAPGAGPAALASAEAVLLGAGHVARHDPAPPADGALPVVVSGRGLVSPAARLFTGERRARVVTSELAPARKRRRLAEVADVVVCGAREVDLVLALAAIAGDVRCVGGARLLRSLLVAGRVDVAWVGLMGRLADDEDDVVAVAGPTAGDAVRMAPLVPVEACIEGDVVWTRFEATR